jgi:DNA-directed RNA polymerase sigma subunit (sigma70/sigma32)
MITSGSSTDKEINSSDLSIGISETLQNLVISKRLSEIEAEILRMRFNLGEYSDFTDFDSSYKGIGEKLNLSRSQVEVLFKKALKRAKSSGAFDQFKIFL